jgi:uncharacterized protein (TIGR02145 family)
MKKIFTVLFFAALVLSASAQEKFRDKRDGTEYHIIKIQGVTWMAENLKYKSPEGSSSFDRDSANWQKYGFLYDWKSATKACPDGWRLPNGEEFEALISNNDQKDTWKFKTSDPSSFGIQLGGLQDYEGNFSEIEESAYFWTSTEYNKDNAQYVSYILISDNPVIDVSRREDMDELHGTEKTNKYSVRCVKVK